MFDDLFPDEQKEWKKCRYDLKDVRKCPLFKSNPSSQHDCYFKASRNGECKASENLYEVTC